MSVLKCDYDDAVSEGVKFMWNSSIESVIDENRIMREVVINSDGKQITTAADVVILAVGSRPASRIISTTTGIDVDDNGYVLTREFPYGMTSRKGVFAGGDVSGNQATVVHAMSNARAVAAGIASYVDALNLMRSIE